MIAAALAAVGAWRNILFIFIVLLNTAIGTVQEIRAKRRTERLSLLTQPAVTVLRDGIESAVCPQEIRTGDTIVLSGGCAVCTDCTVCDGSVEADESVLTGESESVIKTVEDRILSGSSIISGRCLVTALCPAEESYASGMVREVKSAPIRRSMLIESMKKVTRICGFFIVPLGTLMFLQALYLRGAPMASAVISTSAGLLGMLPKGFVLIVSIELAASVVRLSKRNVLVRELSSTESLAECDVICLDKTGTLTEGELAVESVFPDIDTSEFEKLMATYLKYTDDNNSTWRAIREHFGSAADAYEAVSSIPFSSSRKLTSVTLADGRIFTLGAPEKILRKIPAEVSELMSEGRRVLFAGLSRSTDDSIDPVGMIVMTDRLRNSAAETVSYFYRMGIDVKIISGDSPVAAAAAAKQCGVRGAERFTDVSTLSASQLKDTAHTCSIFGRATPETKRDIVAALQACGHKVTMIWDGVNGLLAMRRADCSAAVLSGSDAARTTAELVLPDSDFSALCDVISEGRRTVCNLTRCAGIFFIKTIYSVLICIMCLIMNFEFPFTPIQITLIDAMIEALPALAMSFEFSIYKPEADPIRYALRAALPNSLVILMFCAAITLAALHLGIDKTQEQLLQYLTVGIISIAGVVRANMEHTPGADHRRISHRIRMFRNTSLPAARLSAYYCRKRIPAAVRPYRRCSACRPYR